MGTFSSSQSEAFLSELMMLHELLVIRKVKHDVYGKRQTVGSCVSQKYKYLRFSTCLILLRSYSIFLVNRHERSLIKSSFSVFWWKGNFILPFAVCRWKGNFILPFAVNVTLNLSILPEIRIIDQISSTRNVVEFHKERCRIWIIRDEKFA